MKVTTKITSVNPPHGQFEEVFLVDTGATDCMVPSDKLENIGVVKKGKMGYELADGKVKEN